MEEKNGQRVRMRFFIGVVVVLVVILAVSAVLLVNTGIRQQRYASAIRTANNYYTAGDYQNAVVEYQNAIQIDRKKESAYLNLSTVYVAMGDYISARDIVKQGLVLIDSDTLESRMAELDILVNTEFQEAEGQLLSEERIAEASREAAMENTTFDMVSSYTYTEYFRDFGNPDSAEKEEDQVILAYDNVDLQTVYYDLPSEKVLDNSNSMPIATAKPNQVRFGDVRRLFSVSSDVFAVSYEKLQELLGDSLSFRQEEESGKYYIEAEYKGCRLTVETDSDGNIVSEDAWNELAPLNRSRSGETTEADGEVSGYVQDAVSGSGMKATMKVRNRGSRTGTILEEITSGTDGSYTYSGKQGTYTVEVSASGYVTEYLDIEIVKGQTRTGKNVVLSPEVAQGEIRIVLSWGSFPADLDSHAEGHASSGNRFSIAFNNPDVSGVGQLDVDDRNGYGPETITITDSEAEFTYYVVDFRSEGTMNNSGATVKVYLPGSSQAVTYTVPTEAGNRWDVFRYQDGQLTVINQMR